MMKFTGGSTEIVLGGLKADTLYQLYIVPLTGLLEGSQSRVKKIRTKGTGEFYLMYCTFQKKSHVKFILVYLFSINFKLSIENFSTN